MWRLIPMAEMTREYAELSPFTPQRAAAWHVITSDVAQVSHAPSDTTGS